MATLPQLHPHRLTLSRGRALLTNHRPVPSTPRVEQVDAEQERPAGPTAYHAARPSPAASIVPVLLSLGGLFALAVGSAYTGRAIIEALSGLLAAT
ncbi:hypothetical protein [Sanguibacter sp. 25GB23B1]|uniref:hypothetical protein n=1 Tax=unclassified Sanguibacter TaxID=2645534 RepID=UPI0032AEDCFD